jgi:hypothetical protein
MAKQGEIWWLSDPDAQKRLEAGVDPHEVNRGNELRGDRYIVVISNDTFNTISQEQVQALMITTGAQGARQRGWTFPLVNLPTQTQGVCGSIRFELTI